MHACKQKPTTCHFPPVPEQGGKYKEGRISTNARREVGAKMGAEIKILINNMDKCVNVVVDGMSDR